MRTTITRNNVDTLRPKITVARGKFPKSAKLTEPQHHKTIRQQYELLSSGSTLQGKAMKGMYFGTSEVIRDPRSMDFTEIQARREFLQQRGEALKGELKKAADQVTAQKAIKKEIAKNQEVEEIKTKFYKQNLKKSDD